MKRNLTQDDLVKISRKETNELKELLEKSRFIYFEEYNASYKREFRKDQKRRIFNKKELAEEMGIAENRLVNNLKSSYFTKAFACCLKDTLCKEGVMHE